MKSEWTVSTIDDVCELVTDGAHNSPKSVEDGYYMASVKDFTAYGFDFTNCRKIAELDYLKLKKQGCVPNIGDILVGKDGARYFDDIIIYKQKEQPALLSSIAILRVDSMKMTSEFLYYTLKSPLVKKDVRDNYGSGSAIPRIVLKDFKRMPIFYPSIEEQEKITSISVALDEKIQLNNAINKNLEQQAVVLFRSWFSAFSLSPNSSRINSEFGEIPEDFEVVKAGSLPMLVTDYVANGSFASLKANVNLYQEPNYAYFIRNTDLKSGTFGVFVDQHSYEFLSKSALYGGEIIISNVGDVGSVFLCPKLDGRMTLGNNIIMLRPEDDHLRYYLYIWFKYLQGQALIQGIKGGSAQPKFNKTDFKNTSILIPPKDILNRFHETVAPMFETISQRQTETSRLTDLRDTLLPQLMSGELDGSNLDL